MATYATLTVPVLDIIGADFNASRASVWIEPNVPVVIADSIRVGGRREQVVNGVATFANLVTTNSADNPASFGYRVTITAPPKGAQKREDIVTLTTSDFPFPATANLKSIPQAWDGLATPAEWRSEFRAEMEALRDEAVAIAAGDLTMTIEGIVAAATIKTITDTYTLIADDAGELLKANKGTGFTITIPPESAVAFPVGAIVSGLQFGAGQVTVAAGTGVTLLAPNGTKTVTQYARFDLLKTGADEWLLDGALTT